MTEGQPYLSGSGADERSIVEEMIRDQHSIHWEKCIEFVRRCVYTKAQNIPRALHEEIIQEILYKITRYLPYFRFQCALKTWLNPIIERCIIDVHRRLHTEGLAHFPVGDLSRESEGEELSTHTTMSAEEGFELSEDIRKGVRALLEYANTHSNPIRDRLIIRMVIFEGRTQTETAIDAGCSAAVVGYVVREAQRYAREQVGPKQ